MISAILLLVEYFRINSFQECGRKITNKESNTFIKKEKMQAEFST